MISRNGTRKSVAASGLTKILREEGNGPVVTAGRVVSGFWRMFMGSSLLIGVCAGFYFRHCEERQRRSNPASFRGGISGLLRFARNDGGGNLSRVLPPSFRGDAKHRTRNLEIPGSR